MAALLPPSSRLRAAPGAPAGRPFHVVLVEPEIPPNTGNIARLCGATRCPLHLVGKLGFRTDEKAVRRAGLDYWHLVDVRRHPDLAAAEADIASDTPNAPSPPNAENLPPRSWFFTGRAARSYLEVSFRRGDALVFGRESVGLPTDLIEARRSHAVAIPTLGEVRSLNLANAVAIGVYEALRQVGALATGTSSASADLNSSSSSSESD